MERLDGHAEAGLSGSPVQKAVKHVPLLRRATEPALEQRLFKARSLVTDGQHDVQLEADPDAVALPMM